MTHPRPARHAARVLSPHRPAIRLAAALLAVSGVAAAVAVDVVPAAAAEASPWVRGAQSAARLIGAGPAPAEASTAASAPAGSSAPLLAGLEIRLEPGFITYWRDPGDAGVPPTFAFAGSTNLKSAAVRYPAPSRLDEAGAEAFGYAGGVVFPILVEPVDGSKPVELAVRLDYAACHDICLPAHADLRLTLDRQPAAEAGAEAGRVRDALAAVPRPSTVGAAGPAPRVAAVTAPDAAGGFTVRAALPDAGTAGSSLFVEAPEGWAYAAGPAAPDGPGHAVFPVKRLDAPAASGAGAGRAGPAAPLTLTLVSPEGAVEVPVTLDAAGAKP